MKRQMVRLTESDLHRIIKESVNRVIKESNVNRNELKDARMQIEEYVTSNVSFEDFMLEVGDFYQTLDVNRLLKMWHSYCKKIGCDPAEIGHYY